MTENINQIRLYNFRLSDSKSMLHNLKIDTNNYDDSPDI
jgi:hypothetical protein